MEGDGESLKYIRCRLLPAPIESSSSRLLPLLLLPVMAQLLLMGETAGVRRSCNPRDRWGTASHRPHRKGAAVVQTQPVARSGGKVGFEPATDGVQFHVFAN